MTGNNDGDWCTKSRKSCNCFFHRVENEWNDNSGNWETHRSMYGVKCNIMDEKINAGFKSFCFEGFNSKFEECNIQLRHIWGFPKPKIPLAFLHVDWKEIYLWVSLLDIFFAFLLVRIYQIPGVVGTKFKCSEKKISSFTPSKSRIDIETLSPFGTYLFTVTYCDYKNGSFIRRGKHAALFVSRHLFLNHFSRSRTLTNTMNGIFSRTYDWVTEIWSDPFTGWAMTPSQ